LLVKFVRSRRSITTEAQSHRENKYLSVERRASSPVVFRKRREKRIWLAGKISARPFSRPSGTGQVCPKPPATEVAGYFQATCFLVDLFSDDLRRAVS